jgi:hypothetical protein
MVSGFSASMLTVLINVPSSILDMTVRSAKKMFCAWVIAVSLGRRRYCWRRSHPAGGADAMMKMSRTPGREAASPAWRDVAGRPSVSECCRRSAQAARGRLRIYRENRKPRL